jgi:hypothetical protein
MAKRDANHELCHTDDVTTLKVRWPSGANVFGIVARKASIAKFVAGGEMRHPEGGLLFDNAPLPEGLHVPAVFAQTKLNDTVLSIGGAGAGFPFHNHATAWQSVIHGAKLFLLLPPLNEHRWPEAAAGTVCGFLTRFTLDDVVVVCTPARLLA